MVISISIFNKKNLIFDRVLLSEVSRKADYRKGTNEDLRAGRVLYEGG